MSPVLLLDFYSLKYTRTLFLLNPIFQSGITSSTRVESYRDDSIEIKLPWQPYYIIMQLYAEKDRRLKNTHFIVIICMRKIDQSLKELITGLKNKLIITVKALLWQQAKLFLSVI